MVSAEKLLDMWRTMVRIRSFEESVLALADEDLVPGLAHPYTGHEAIATGVIGQRRPDEWVVSYYRCHGHALACGSDPEALLREILGREGGICEGKGGSMHLADRANHLLGASSIIASQLGVAAGVAMSAQADGDGKAVMVFSGDGALGAGVAYETLTIARKRNLPLLYVCEDNGWQDHTVSSSVAALRTEELLAGLGFDVPVVDGNDVEAVSEAAEEALDACRAGNGPRVIVAKTYLRHFHAQLWSRLPHNYRPADEVEAKLADDPVLRAEARVKATGVDTDQVRAEIQDEIRGVVARARSAGYPHPDTATTSLTVSGVLV